MQMLKIKKNKFRYYNKTEILLLINLIIFFLLLSLWCLLNSKPEANFNWPLGQVIMASYGRSQFAGVPGDAIAHFIVGLFITISTRPFFKFHTFINQLLILLALGSYKEYLDSFRIGVTAAHHLKDIFFTILPCFLMAYVQNLRNYRRNALIQSAKIFKNK